MLAAKAPPPGADQGDDQDPAAGGDDGSPDEGEQAAAEDMMHALKSGDASALAAAMKAFVQMCSSKY
jgi:hypothetical protein